MHDASIAYVSLAGSLLAILLYGGFAAAYAFKVLGVGQGGGKASWLFLAGLVLSVAWSALGAARNWWPHADVLEALQGTADMLRYGTWFLLVEWLLRSANAGPGLGVLSHGLRLALLGVLLRIALSWCDAFRWWPELNPANSGAYLTMALAVYGLTLVEQLHKNVSEDSRWNAKPVCIGLATIFAFDLYVYSQVVLFRESDLEALSLRGAVHALAVPLLFLASRRHKDWIAKLHVSRTAVFHSATLILSGAYLLVVSGLGYYVRYTGGEFGRALQIVLLVCGLIVLLVMLFSGAMRSKLKVYISKNFFSFRYDYRQEWLRFTAMLSAQESPEGLGRSIVESLAHLVETSAGALWLVQGPGKDLVQAVRLHAARSTGLIPLDSPFCEFLSQNAWIVDLDAHRSRAQGQPDLPLPDCLLEEQRNWLVIPLMVGSRLLGLVVLEHPRTPLDLNWEVRDLLKTASRQAAGYLAQMQATEALLESRKFDAFNKMSAFVVHDLKNIVTQLSLMMKNAQRHRDNPEFQEDMLATVENSLEKMRQLLLQLREGQRPHGVSSGVELLPIIERLRHAAQGKGRELELQGLEPIQTRGHEERVERVIGHAVQNAFDATPPHGRVWISLQRRGSSAVLEIGDTGSGMSEDFVQNRLFRPFQTTKETGMGIGAYESYQYIQELGGRIEVSSAVGQGTRLTFYLPLFHVQQDSGLHLTEEA